MYDIYQERILLYYRKPPNFGPLDHADLNGEESNPLCGDHIEMHLRLDPSKSRVEEIRFTGDGCAISMASAGMLTEKIRGKTLGETAAFTQEDVLKLVGIPLSPVRIKCALTGFAALGRALGTGAGGASPPPA